MKSERLLGICDEYGTIWSGEPGASERIGDLVQRGDEETYEVRLVGGVSRLVERELELKAKLNRATYVAEHLHAMIDRETWRATGGDDGQGHYEGDYRAETLLTEIRGWTKDESSD